MQETVTVAESAEGKQTTLKSTTSIQLLKVANPRWIICKLYAIDVTSKKARISNKKKNKKPMQIMGFSLILLGLFDDVVIDQDIAIGLTQTDAVLGDVMVSVEAAIETLVATDLKL